MTDKAQKRILPTSGGSYERKAGTFKHTDDAGNPIPVKGSTTAPPEGKSARKAREAAEKAKAETPKTADDSAPKKR